MNIDQIEERTQFLFSREEAAHSPLRTDRGDTLFEMSSQGCLGALRS